MATPSSIPLLRSSPGLRANTGVAKTTLSGRGLEHTSKDRVRGEEEGEDTVMTVEFLRDRKETS